MLDCRIIVSLVYILHHCSACHTSACTNIQVTLSSSTGTTTLELGSTTTNTLRCDINYWYDSCCYRYGHLNVTWYNDDIAINSNPAFSTNGTYLYVSSFGTYYSTLTINSSVNITHSGTYKCAAKVVNGYGNTYGPNVSASVNLTLQIPEPISVLTGNSTLLAGTTATLHCTEYLHQYISYLSLPTTLTVELLKGTTTVMTRSIALYGSVTVHTSVFTIPNVGVSNAGQYQCRATVSTTQNGVIDSSPGVSNTANLTVQIPQPSVFLTGGSVTVGSTATLQCNVILQQYTSYSIAPITLTVVLLKGTATLMIDSNPTGSSSVRNSVFTIPNAGVSNAGQYRCRATVRTTQNNVIDSSPGVSSTANIYIKIPQPQPLLIGGATLSVGSTAILQCNVALQLFTGYSSIPITVTVELLKGYTPVMTESATVHSSVHATAFNISDVSVANAGQYRCRATVRTTQNNVIDSSPGVSSTANIYIKIPQPQPLLTGGTTFSVGSTATLQCNVTLQLFTGYSSIPITVTVALLKGYTPVMTDLASVDSSVHTAAFNISDVGVSNAGQYRCTATVRTTQNNVIDSDSGVSNTANLNVLIPQPTLMLTGDSVVVGTTATLQCAVILQKHTNFLSIPITVTVELYNKDKGYIAAIKTSSNPTSSVHISGFNIYNVVVSKAGQYQCRATVRTTQSNVIDSSPGVSNTANLTVQIPAPSATLSSTVAVLDSPAILQCTVVLHSSLTCSGPVTTIVDLFAANSTTPLNTSQTAAGFGSICTVPLTVTLAATSNNGGPYQCGVNFNYTASNSVFVLLPDQIYSYPALLYVVDSTVTAVPSIVLNVFPYNMFILTCSVVVHPTTTPIVTYQWTGNNVPMINTSSVSVLSNAVGSSYYQCNVTVTVSLLNTVISSNTAAVTVKGSSPPSTPVGITASSGADTANISFIVPRVTYTPETYSVRYGVTVNDIKLTSTTVTSAGVDSNLGFITTLNQRYHITLFGLTTNTTYYYQVVNSNCVGSVLTQVFNFTTHKQALETAGQRTPLLNSLSFGLLAGMMVGWVLFVTALVGCVVFACKSRRKHPVTDKKSNDSPVLIYTPDVDGIYEIPEPAESIQMKNTNISGTAKQPQSTNEYEQIKF